MNAAAQPSAAGALLFRLEDGVFAFPLADVAEVLRAAWPIPLPRAPYGCPGLLDVRGELVPLVDLGAVLALRKPLALAAEPERLLDTHVLLLSRADGAQLGCMVTRVLEIAPVEPLPAREQETAAATLGKAAQWVIGGATGSGARALVIDPWRLLGASRVRMLRRALSRAAEAPR